jgi:hypothetical protein
MQKRMNTEEILAKLAEMRASLPPHKSPPRRKAPEGASRLDVMDLEDFEMTAVADAIRDFADEVQAVADEARKNLFEKVLDIYYAAEELARDPEHANMIEHVEAMRAAYQRDYGHPIPTREETEARRARERG